MPEAQKGDFCSASPSCCNAPTLIHQNAVQPRAKAVAFLVPIQRTVGAEKGGLQRIFRVVAVAQHPYCKPCTAIVVPIDQRGVSVNIACQHALNVGSIVAHVLFYNPPLFAQGHIRL